MKCKIPDLNKYWIFNRIQYYKHLNDKWKWIILINEYDSQQFIYSLFIMNKCSSEILFKLFSNRNKGRQIFEEKIYSFVHFQSNTFLCTSSLIHLICLCFLDPHTGTKFCLTCCCNYLKSIHNQLNLFTQYDWNFPGNFRIR